MDTLHKYLINKGNKTLSIRICYKSKMKLHWVKIEYV